MIRVLDCCLVPKPRSAISTLLLAFTIIYGSGKVAKKTKTGRSGLHSLHEWIHGEHREGVLKHTRTSSFLIIQDH